MNQPPIATIAAPTRLREQQTFVTEVYQARERLFEAARHFEDSKATMDASYALSSLTLAEIALTAAGHHVAGANAWVPNTEHGTALNHATNAIRVALAHTKLHRDWLTDATTQDRHLVATQVQRSRSHAVHATEAARAEAHRALDIFSRRFPQAIEMDED